MSTRLDKIRQSKEAQVLEAAGLQFGSTDRQIDNGTIVFAGNVNGQRVKYEVTASGAVLSNKFVARRAFGRYPLDQYRRGLREVLDLLSKRQ